MRISPFRRFFFGFFVWALDGTEAPVSYSTQRITPAFFFVVAACMLDSDLSMPRLEAF